MRSKHKKDKEFEAVFLAQELRCKKEKKRHSVGPEEGKQPSGAAGVQNPVWALEFSKDGRYLAAGGQDRVVRVWAVLSKHFLFALIFWPWIVHCHRIYSSRALCIV